MLQYTPENISAFLKTRIDSLNVKSENFFRGSVAAVGDGVVRINDLPGRRCGELLEFENGVYGMALDLERDTVGAVIIDNGDSVSVGDTVIGTNRVAEIPAGKELLGRVIDSIGRPLDNMPLNAKKYVPVEKNAPAIMARRPVDTPLETGVLAIDSMVPIGRGQRELIIGDRQTGKTSIAVDSIINQKGGGVLCVYCAIGQKASSIAGVIDTLKKSGALEYTVVVAATASDSPAMQYLAPYAATAVAEEFMEQGRDVLVVYDDLSKHAVAYRTMSLLLHRPPGREAYPGDVFYLHSRLLERSACMSKENGGGSITALPIIETMGGNISAYIPTNVISITDGQIYLESELFHSGIRPAVNTGLSVSRVGRAAQTKAMRSVSGTLRIELSRYREMAVFTRFGSDVDPATAKMLKKGQILTELLKQPKSAPLCLSEQVSVLLAFGEGVLDNLAVNEVIKFKNKLIKHLNKNLVSVMNDINKSGEISDQNRTDLLKGIRAFGEVYGK